MAAPLYEDTLNDLSRAAAPGNEAPFANAPTNAAFAGFTAAPLAPRATAPTGRLDFGSPVPALPDQ